MLWSPIIAANSSLRSNGAQREEWLDGSYKSFWIVESHFSRLSDWNVIIPRKKNEIFTFLQFYWEKVKEILILTKALFRGAHQCSLVRFQFFNVHLMFFGPPPPLTCSQVLRFKCNFKLFHYLCFSTHICEWPSVKSQKSVRNEWLTPVFKKKSVSLLKGSETHT